MPKLLEKTYTFAVSDENAAVGSRLPGFSDVATLICESLPMAKVGHRVMVYFPYARPCPLVGEADIIGVKRGVAQGSGERYTALAIRMLPSEFMEEEE